MKSSLHFSLNSPVFSFSAQLLFFFSNRPNLLFSVLSPHSSEASHHLHHYHHRYKKAKQKNDSLFFESSKFATQKYRFAFKESEKSKLKRSHSSSSSSLSSSSSSSSSSESSFGFFCKKQESSLCKKNRCNIFLNETSVFSNQIQPNFLRASNFDKRRPKL